MMVRRTLGVCATFVLACGPGEPDDTAPDAGTSTSGAGMSTSGSAPTTSTSGARADDCGPAPAPPACTPDDASDSRVALCDMRDEAGCAGPIDESGAECRWVATAAYAHDAVTCEAPTTGGACIAVLNFGDGCDTVTACGDDTEGPVFFRTVAACQTQVFLGGFCGYTVLGWNTCAWDDPATETCALPHPTLGPATCNCAC